MARAVDIIKENCETLFRLRRIGIKNIDNLTDYYSVYQIYLGYDNVKEKMVRYSMTGEKAKVSTQSVISIVKLMERQI